MSYKLKEIIKTVILMWIIISFIGSLIKTGAGNCGNNYQIDYAFNNNLFCEIKQ